jgi:hypothetical protein
MPGDTDSTQDHKLEGKGNPKPVPRKSKPSSDDPDTFQGTQSDETETDSAASDKPEEFDGTPGSLAATHRSDPVPAETKKAKPPAGKNPKAPSLADRMRFSRRIKPRR